VGQHGEYRDAWDEIGGFTRPVFIPHGLTEETLRAYYQRSYDTCYYRLDQILMPWKRFPSGAHVGAWLRFTGSKALGAVRVGRV
jgi:hypothetical protein